MQSVAVAADDAVALSARAMTPGGSAWSAFVNGHAFADEAVSALDGLSRLEAIPDGGWIVCEDRPATELIGLVIGEAVVGFGGSDESDEAFVAQRSLIGPCWIDASSAWCARQHAQSVRAVGSAEVLRAPVGALRGLVLEWPHLAVFFLDLLSREIGRLTVDMNELLQKDAEARLASWLMRRIESGGEPGHGAGEIQLTERKRQIATQLGVKPETLSRLLRALNRKGLVEVLGYRVRVLDPEGLKALAAG